MGEGQEDVIRERRANDLLEMPRRAADVNRDSGTTVADRRWLQRMLGHDGIILCKNKPTRE